MDSPSQRQGTCRPRLYVPPAARQMGKHCRRKRDIYALFQQESLKLGTKQNKASLNHFQTLLKKLSRKFCYIFASPTLSKKRKKLKLVTFTNERNKPRIQRWRPWVQKANWIQSLATLSGVAHVLTFDLESENVWRTISISCAKFKMASRSGDDAVNVFSWLAGAN